MFNVRLKPGGVSINLDIDRATVRMIEGFAEVVNNVNCRYALHAYSPASMTIKQIQYIVIMDRSANRVEYKMSMFFVDVNGVPECFAATAIFDEADYMKVLSDRQKVLRGDV